LTDRDDLTPEQCRAARGLVDWSRSDLAAKTKVGLSTIKRFEAAKLNAKGSGLLTSPLVRATLRRALEDGGVIFFESRLVEGRVLTGVALVEPPS
jgi:hypothetical protein